VHNEFSRVGLVGQWQRQASSHVPIQSPASRIPDDIRCARDYEIAAQRFMAESVYAYIHGGSALDQTSTANPRAFGRWTVCPRLLGDIRQSDTRVQLPGAMLDHPVLLAPVAYQNLAHPEGEIAVARAAAATGSAQILSTLSSFSLEEVAQSAPARRWFQLYLQPDRNASLDLIRRAETAGYKAIMLTLDATLQIPSARAQATGFTLPAACVAANLQQYGRPDAVAGGMALRRDVIGGLLRHAPCWSDLEAVLAHTQLPVWVKGVMHPDDARALQGRGVAGAVVSNHGGRALDGAPAALQMLPLIRSAVGAQYPILFDSGIRSGTDVFKAIALGADAVMIGRAQMYALSVAGALGVAHLLTLLREELAVCMAHAGCRSLADIRSATLIRNGATEVRDECASC
jgi:4-hydroxymandelate oxidase